MGFNLNKAWARDFLFATSNAWLKTLNLTAARVQGPSGVESVSLSSLGQEWMFEA